MDTNCTRHSTFTLFKCISDNSQQNEPISTIVAMGYGVHAFNQCKSKPCTGQITILINLTEFSEPETDPIQYIYS